MHISPHSYQDLLRKRNVHSLISSGSFPEGQLFIMVVGGNKVEVVVDESVRDEFIHTEKEDSYVGLLIGSYSENGTYCVAHKAATLEEDDDSTTPSSGNSSPAPSPSPPPHLPLSSP
ncbi:hypothetical protein Ocin01_16176 [Orchesella cincta]|uniref:Uncharacterized protein n=1 Tax=Orchesella cincta TaxID=48709 RepID=A0A1D2MBZ5_ORCCI|nr:hypothetical protein Ocin01_16176 [Orchesella cincta]